MATKMVIDPVTRIEGHLKIEVTADLVNGLQQVVDARATGTLFRGFETILRGRDPFDAPDITARICGVCPTPHNQAAVAALDAAMGIQVPDNARLLRNLVLAADFLHSHILHFYQLAALDFMVAAGHGAVAAGLERGHPVRRGHEPDAAEPLRHGARHAPQGARDGRGLRRAAAAHARPSSAAGSPARRPPAQIQQFRAYAAEILPFIRDVYLPDVDAVARTYGDYYQVGAGPQEPAGLRRLRGGPAGQRPGCSGGGAWRRARRPCRPVDVKAIAEDVTASWYSDRSGLNPASGTTTPSLPEGRRLLVAEVAALRAQGLRGRAAGADDRQRRLPGRRLGDGPPRGARGGGAEDRLGASTAGSTQLVPSRAGVRRRRDAVERVGHRPDRGAARRARALAVGVGNGRISRYQIVTPTCWNASPRDARAVPGALEQALVGTPVRDTDAADRGAARDPLVRPVPVVRGARHAARPARGGVGRVGRGLRRAARHPRPRQPAPDRRRGRHPRAARAGCRPAAGRPDPRGRHRRLRRAAGARARDPRHRDRRDRRGTAARHGRAVRTRCRRRATDPAIAPRPGSAGARSNACRSHGDRRSSSSGSSPRSSPWAPRCRRSSARRCRRWCARCARWRRIPGAHPHVSSRFCHHCHSSYAASPGHGHGSARS